MNGRDRHYLLGRLFHSGMVHGKNTCLYWRLLYI